MFTVERGYVPIWKKHQAGTPVNYSKSVLRLSNFLFIFVLDNQLSRI